MKMNPESYSVCGPIKGVCKQSAIWVNEGSFSAPIAYLQRPKWIKDDSVWAKIVSSIRIELSATEIK